ncbi:J domain-containing protein [Methanococcoides orientis]|uniref:J domain-containing protein n=1 Tax=Methanococcoides orientis TaxID=2822137 RepID=UPI001E2B6634|nr:J domain-containing protein [Methanococcoides orientis]UGV39786.1 J domain-containing protein [Methanococcoides orientis]
MVKIKGHEIDTIIIKSAGNRRAMQFKNNIITVLRKIGINENDIDIPLERLAMKKAKASATWYLSDHRMHYSHNLQNKYVENLHILSRVIEIEVNRVLSEEKTLSDFILEFKEDSDVYNKRIEAREFFDCDHDETDFEIINKKYKLMAKELHPDMPTGDTEKFKKLNIAHKILKRELT